MKKKYKKKIAKRIEKIIYKKELTKSKIIQIITVYPILRIPNWDFLLPAQQPKWQKSCSKMWSIEQLYIELGLQ